ncbi:cid1 family poly A polymerase domain-containing protein [Sarocladium implicatum]|nr:cid1 family poly A polymerase domain-containing protein [Sarocladium implicatum]
MGDSNRPGSDRPPLGLEEHLHNLIISNGRREASSASQGLSSDVLLQDSVPERSPNGGDVQPVTRGGGKKRPNQAQRRQMNAQLSLDVDTRAVEQPSHQQHFQQHRGGYGQQGRGISFANQRNSTTQAHHPISHQGQQWTPNVSHHQHGRWNQGPFGQQGHNSPSTHQQPEQPFRRNSAQSQNFRPGSGYQGHHHQHQQTRPSPEELAAQCALLERLCFQVNNGSEIEFAEIADKEAFRQRIEHLSREVIAMHEIQQNSNTRFPPQSVELKCFGSLSSGFATKASDMDLGLLSPLSAMQPDRADSPIPRLLEKALLDAGFGARLLTRTRVPIIKLCEKPPAALLEDLRSERLKWEKEASREPNDANDVQEDVPPIENATPADEDEYHESQVKEEEVEPEYYFDIPWQTGRQPLRLWLKQSRNQSLSNYHNVAKRVLRKAGGRDVTTGNYRELSEHEWDILNCVCKAFVNGMEDTKLRDDLRTLPSLAFNPLQGQVDRHSLAAVTTQIEGELLLQSWDEKIAIHGMSPKPRHGHAVIQWAQLRGRETYGMDPISWAKELQLALERVKKLPSVQLITLEQQEHELPTAYYNRAKNVIRILTEHNQEPLHIMPRQYLAGIQPVAVRKEVAKSVEDSSGEVGMAALSRIHKCLHLAIKLEEAVAKNLYDEAQISDIKAYIALLRTPLINISTDPATPDWIIPIGTENAALIARVSAIQDPHTFAVNQPRDRYRDKLEFPKTGVGAQCDINFSAHLALQNTLLLRCYSHADPRVRPMVLFIKHWAKVRGINSGYRGTLSSYGYVLMVLHYLVNVAKPFVCPNLQQLAPPPPPNMTPQEAEGVYVCRGYDVGFWRNEEEILRLARSNMLTHNKDPLGHLLRGFFEYYAQSNMMSDGSGRGFDWGRDVLSLRSQGGLLSKQEKGWTGAKTTVEVRGPVNASRSSQQADIPSPASPLTPQRPLDSPAVAETPPPANKATAGGEVKEVRHRYLFAIEDPFELEHNVARTVTHNGIVSIRDEFRRAWRIIRAAGQGVLNEDLLQDVNAVTEGGKTPFLALLDDIHGFAG